MKEGWLLDAYIEGSSAVLWIKHNDGIAVKIKDEYNPSFYVKPVGITAECLAEILSEHPDIMSVLQEDRFTRLDAEKPTAVLKIIVSGPNKFKSVHRQVKALEYVGETFNTDLLHIQRYIFELSIVPMARNLYEADGERMISIQSCDEELRSEPPPFKVSKIKVKCLEKNSRIEVQNGDAKRIFSGKGMLKDFQNCLDEFDPDILVAYEQDLGNILENAESSGIKISFGREPLNNNRRGYVKGRVRIEPRTFNRLGLAGLAERARFTMVPAGMSADWPAGKTIDSRQCYEAHRKGYLIPRAGFFQHTVLLYDLLDLDRGGLILSPEVGLHENAAIIDFESMFPHIITCMNVSYETVQSRTNKLGLMVGFTEETLRRRMHFKHLRKKLQFSSQEYSWCEQRQLALKEVLVCDYGYSGCFANRFGNVRTYQEINYIARKTLVQSMNIAQSLGFKILYGNNDSLFVSKFGATRETYEKLAFTIAEQVGLPMTLDNHFKFLILLPQKSRELGAANHYYGKLYNGEFECRGIELRRRDTPPLIRKLQKRLMYILLDAQDANEVNTKNLKRAQRYVENICERIREGKIKNEEFVVSRQLGKPLTNYKSMAPHVAAAWNLNLGGQIVEEGEIIDYVFVSQNRNPLRRVKPTISRIQDIDTEKYVSLTIDAANSILSVFNQI